MKTPHKHAATIKLWADGATVQMRHYQGSPDEWADCNGAPQWSGEWLYRVKPERETITLPTGSISKISEYLKVNYNVALVATAQGIAEACELQLVVPMAEVQEVARGLAKAREQKVAVCVLERVIGYMNRNQINWNTNLLRSDIDLHAIIASIKD
jgi:hypothetical protein